MVRIARSSLSEIGPPMSDWSTKHLLQKSTLQNYECETYIVVSVGEIEWAKNGRFAGISEIPLTPHGEEQVVGTSRIVIGPGKLVDPAKLASVFISPRIRVQKTFELLFNEGEKDRLREAGIVKTTEKLAERRYRIYEGLKEEEIRASRKKRGLNQEKPWDIWTDGCEEV
jgi:sedoheptulose-bisphosphatase